MRQWRYEIQYGPEGEENYAWVYVGNEMVATMKTHHAKKIVESMNFMGKIKMFRARKSEFNDSWLVEQEIPCINGLSAWFEIAVCHQTSEAEMGYTDGKHGTAEDRAVFIAAALNDLEAGF